MLLNAYIIIFIIMAFVAATIISSGKMLEVQRSKVVSIALSSAMLVGMTLAVFSVFIGCLSI